MFDMEQKNRSSDILCKEIREQSDEEVQVLMDQAEKEVQRILDEARQDAQKRCDELNREARIQAEHIRKKILSGVHLEIKKENLSSREEMFVKIFKMVRDRFDQFRKTPEYRSFLKRLIQEGAMALDQETLQIQSGDAERKILHQEMLREIEKSIQKQSGKNIHLMLSDTMISDGGVVLVSSNGRTRFDNTLSARMKRMQDEMRLMAIKRIFG